MPTRLVNYNYGIDWTHFHMEYYEGYRPNMSDYHMHEYYEISFILSGDVKILLPHTNQQGTQTRLVLTRPMTPHLMICEPHMIYKRINLLFSNEFLTDYVPEWKYLVSVFGKNGAVLLLKEEDTQDFLRMTDELQAETDLFRIRLRLLLFLSRISDLMKDTSAEAMEELPPYVTGALSYLQKHYTEKIVASDLAWHLGVGRTTLMTAFKKYTGSTINDYLTRYRLKQALRRLREGETVQNTAEACGFGDLNNLIRAFRHQFGTTPKQYIKSLNNDQAEYERH